MSLSEEDRNWIAAELAKVVAGTERVIAGEVAKVVAGTERVIAGEVAKVRADFQHVLEVELAKVRSDIERVETSLLTEFHKWASPMEMRVRSHSFVLRALDLETESISERVEKREPPH